MTTRKLILALALLASTSGVTFAQGARYYYGAPYAAPGYYGNFGEYYDYSPGYGYGNRSGGPFYDSYGTAPYVPGDEPAQVVQPNPRQGVESQR